MSHGIGLHASRRRSRGSSGPALPGTITKLGHWYAGAGRTMNGGNVQVLADQSGIGDANRNLTQLTAGAQPIYVASNAAFNGQPTLTMDGARYMQTATFAAQLPTQFRHYWVGTQANTAFFYMVDSITAAQAAIYKTPGGGKTSVWAGAEIFLACDSTVKHVLAAEFNGATSKLAYNAKTFGVTGNAGTNLGRTGVTIGAYAGNPTSATYHQVGTFAEASLTVVPPSAAEHNAIMDYLAAKYGITIGA